MWFIMVNWFDQLWKRVEKSEKINSDIVEPLLRLGLVEVDQPW